MSAKNKVSTTVLTGFLGAGKTTIVSHLIKYLREQDVNVIYIKNEIGETDLDAKLMRGENIVSREILNGCICCTLVGPFINAIEEVITTYNPDRIIIESAGTADPASLALMVSDHPLLERDGIISIIDVLNFEGYQDISPVAKRQAEMTDLIVLNKVEQVDLEHKRRVVGYIRELNESTPIVEAPLGKLNPSLAFGIIESDIEILLGHHELHDHDSHLEDDQIQGITFKTDKPIDKKAFFRVLEQLPKSIFRVKGVVNFEDGPQVVNSIFKRADVTELPENLEANGTLLICIGFRVEDRKNEIFTLLNQSITKS